MSSTGKQNTITYPKRPFRTPLGFWKEQSGLCAASLSHSTGAECTRPSLLLRTPTRSMGLNLSALSRLSSSPRPTATFPLNLLGLSRPSLKCPLLAPLSPRNHLSNLIASNIPCAKVPKPGPSAHSSQTQVSLPSTCAARTWGGFKTCAHSTLLPPEWGLIPLPESGRAL